MAYAAIQTGRVHGRAITTATVPVMDIRDGQPGFHEQIIPTSSNQVTVASASEDGIYCKISTDLPIQFAYGASPDAENSPRGSVVAGGSTYFTMQQGDRVAIVLNAAG